MIKIFLIENQKIVREGLKVLLEAESDLQVYASENKDVKISLMQRLKPDLLLVSLDNLDQADFDYLKIFHDLNHNSAQLKYLNQIKIIVYGDKVDDMILNQALQLGCAGYLLKDSSIEELKQAIRSVFNGYKHIGNSVFTQLKQFTLPAYPSEKTLAANLVKTQKYDHTGLVSTSNNELDFEELNHNRREVVSIKSQESLLPELPRKSSSISLPKDSQSPRQNWLHNIGSSLLLTSLGCAVGIVSVLYIRDRATQSFSPIIKNGIVKGEIMPIKAPYLGIIKQLPYEVGDLVKADAIVAKLEPQSARKQGQVMAEIEQQIEKTQQQIENQKQLLAVAKSRFNGEQEKLQELLVNNSKVWLSRELQPKEANAQAEVNVAFTNYQELQQLKKQQAVSQAELERAKQVWKTAKNKLTLIQNNQQAQESELSEKEVRNQADQLENIAYLQANSDSWKIQAIQLESSIKSMVENLNNAQEGLVEAKNSYQQQQLIKLKAPFTGVISQINQTTNDLLIKEQTIIELLNCHHLWVEVIVDDNLLAGINLRQLVMLDFDDTQLSLYGAISSLQPVQITPQNYLETYLENTSSILTNQETNLTENYPEAQSFYKIKIDLPLLDNYAQQYNLCGSMKTAMVTFNHNHEN